MEERQAFHTSIPFQRHDKLQASIHMYRDHLTQFVKVMFYQSSMGVIIIILLLLY
jgi:hypothetical protein